MFFKVLKGCLAVVMVGAALCVGVAMIIIGIAVMF